MTNLRAALLRLDAGGRIDSLTIARWVLDVTSTNAIAAASIGTIKVRGAVQTAANGYPAFPGGYQIISSVTA